ncbi:hypothetical protein Amsp01_048890 [Amycolatopsis sp. NBRC 101858]|uniref:hypothetical protein n=1 Tax=Amycolatopsis sp. NBRC 101858 TaxID=3032200 RepID=UPI0024A271A0|nr:hypothetical protein [Amycolatopsis sp. NBRC 101858]GLY38865.1 hypothetical protein Amsp01_048890 [Amycolatopsis sp. NBRC 101858]
MTVPVSADPEVATAVFTQHVAEVSASAQAREHGWVFTPIDPLHVVVTLTATRPDGGHDTFHVKLGAEFYDAFPPTTSFVSPPRGEAPGVPPRNGWQEASPASQWMPTVTAQTGFAVHHSYTYPPEASWPDMYRPPRQLVCCSMTFEYYISSHTPTDGQRWTSGRHTLAATLNRIQDALTDTYLGPSGADDS